MNAFSRRTAWSILALALMCLSVKAPMALTATSRIVSAANTFLSTLDQRQRQSVLFAFDDEKQESNRSNLPMACWRGIHAWSSHCDSCLGKTSTFTSSSSMPKPPSKAKCGNGIRITVPGRAMTECPRRVP